MRYFAKPCKPWVETREMACLNYLEDAGSTEMSGTFAVLSAEEPDLITFLDGVGDKLWRGTKWYRVYSFESGQLNFLKPIRVQNATI